MITAVNVGDKVRYNGHEALVVAVYKASSAAFASVDGMVTVELAVGSSTIRTIPGLDPSWGA